LLFFSLRRKDEAFLQRGGRRHRGVPVREERITFIFLKKGVILEPEYDEMRSTRRVTGSTETYHPLVNGGVESF